MTGLSGLYQIRRANLPKLTGFIRVIGSYRPFLRILSVFLSELFDVLGFISCESHRIAVSVHGCSFFVKLKNRAVGDKTTVSCPCPSHGKKMETHPLPPSVPGDLLRRSAPAICSVDLLRRSAPSICSGCPAVRCGLALFRAKLSAYPHHLPACVRSDVLQVTRTQSPAFLPSKRPYNLSPKRKGGKACALSPCRCPIRLWYLLTLHQA